jgi:hypothetical protein
MREVLGWPSVRRAGCGGLGVGGSGVVSGNPINGSLCSCSGSAILVRLRLCFLCVVVLRIKEQFTC